MKSREPDEYVVIRNAGTTPAQLAGWVLRDITTGFPAYTFPAYLLEPGASVRLYTNEVHPEWGGFSFNYGNAIWNNTSPDTAALFDPAGREVSRRSYPPGCGETAGPAPTAVPATAVPAPTPDPPATTGCLPGQIDINSASVSQLQEIRHIGDIRARQILELRAQQPFASVDDMARIDGIVAGGQRLRDIKEDRIACVA